MKNTARRENIKICIIGGGAMGSALARGLLKSGYINPYNITVAEPLHPEMLADLKEQGVRIFSSNIEAMEGADLIIVAVKPWIVKDVIKEIENAIDPHKMEVSFIVAGINAHDLAGMFTENLPDNLSITMPNTAMSVGVSMTFIVTVNGKPDLTLDVFKQVGEVMQIEERQLQAATALASCGIAYALRYVRAACEGGVELGFQASEAKEIVIQTLAGAVALLKKPDAHPETEIDKVTTPGGITIRGLNAMERNGFTTAVIEGLKASR